MKYLIAAIVALAIVAGAFYYAKKSGEAECKAKIAEQFGADAIQREKDDHEIRHISDVDLDGRLDRWMRD